MFHSWLLSMRMHNFYVYLSFRCTVEIVVVEYLRVHRALVLPTPGSTTALGYRLPGSLVDAVDDAPRCISGGCGRAREVVAVVVFEKWWLWSCLRSGGCGRVREVVAVVLVEKWWLWSCSRSGGCGRGREVVAVVVVEEGLGVGSSGTSAT